MDRPPLDVVLPVHNEAGTIEAFLREVLAALEPHVVPRLIVCEDGSRDGTADVLRRIVPGLPVHLITGPERKGYTRALLDGLGVSTTDWVLSLDTDGQCDPRDFATLWPLRNGADVVIGWRRDRADRGWRRLASRAFGAVYGGLFQAPVHDPSCPYALMRRAAVAPLLDRFGLLPYGFWWELVARAQRGGLRLAEVAIHHRPRAAGATRVFTARKLPGLVVTHLVGLVRLWGQTR